MLSRPEADNDSSGLECVKHFNFSIQASGYASGDDAYEDMEGRDEVKKIVEEREYNMVCTYSHALKHNTLSPPSLPFSSVGLGPKNTQLLSLQAWWRLEHGDMCCSLPALCKRKQGYDRATEDCEIILVQEVVPHF